MNDQGDAGGGANSGPTLQVQPAAAPEQGSPRAGSGQWFKALSLSKKLVAAFIAIAAGIGTTWGAVQAVQGVRDLLRAAEERSNPSDFRRTPWLGIEVWQDDRRIGLFEEAVERSWADIEPGPFELRFPREYADAGLRLVAWTDSTFEVDRDAPAGLQSDGTVSNVFLGPGTGFAITRSGSSELIISDQGHNVLTTDMTDPVSGDQVAAYYSRYLFGAGVGDGSGGPMKELADTSLHLTAWADVDADGIVDWTEYEHLRLDL